jgi:hypothetical protein
VIGRGQQRTVKSAVGNGNAPAVGKDDKNYLYSLGFVDTRGLSSIFL